MRSRNEVSAGGVVFRRTDGDKNGVEVLVCKDAGYHRWVLPKGSIEKGESPEQAATREVAEEAGVIARIIESLGEPERYVYRARDVLVFKLVHYFLMEYESGSETEHDAEMEAVNWVPLEEAIALVAYQGAKEVLRRAQERLHSNTMS